MGAAPALPVPPGLASCRALLAYDDRARASVIGLKNRDRRALVTALADGLAALVPGDPGLVVTWAPTSGAPPPAARLRPGRAARPGRRPPAPAAGAPAAASGGPAPPRPGAAAGERWQHPGFVAARPCAPAAVLVDRRRRHHRRHPRRRPPRALRRAGRPRWSTASWSPERPRPSSPAGRGVASVGTTRPGRHALGDHRECPSHRHFTCTARGGRREDRPPQSFSGRDGPGRGALLGGAQPDGSPPRRCAR